MLRLAYWCAILFFVALVAAQFDRSTGFTRLIRFGETWQSRRLPGLQNSKIATVPNSSGYDGQFYAQIALDPLLRDPNLAVALDAPAYRARRILAPATAALLGFGHSDLTLQIYSLLNVACWAVLAWLLYGEIGARPGDWIAFARWFGCLFGMGVLESVRQSLVDLPALLLLFFAVRAHRHTNRIMPTTLGLALGHLAKETNLLASIALLARPKFSSRSLAILLGSLVPLGCWTLYVASRFPATGQTGLGNFTWPLAGAIAQLNISGREVLHGNFDSRHTFALLAMAGFFVQIFTLWRDRQLDSPWWRIGAAYALLLLFLGPWVWSGYWAVCRAVLPLTIAFNLLLPARRSFWPLWILGNITLLHAVWRFL